MDSTFGCFKPDSSVPSLQLLLWWRGSEDIRNNKLTYSNQELEGMENCIGIQSPQQTVVLEQKKIEKKLLLKHFP